MVACLLFIFQLPLSGNSHLLRNITQRLLVNIIIAIMERDRSFHTLDQSRVPGLREQGDWFPRGHTMRIFFRATMFIHNFQFGLAESLALYAVATLVGSARIYIGAHYPRDVLAGIALGSV